MTVRHDLRLALELADVADAVTMGRYLASDLQVETKPDMTPVSEADRAAEQAIRDHLATTRPDDGVLGEEFGHTEGNGRTWILDPIDATKNYVRGLPIWGSLIALEDDGEVTVGVVSSPALGHRWWAAKGEGSWCNARRLQVSSISRIEDAQLSYNSLVEFEEQGLGEQGLALSKRCWRTRGLGDFWSFMLIAEGAVDIAVEPIAAVWDLAPLGIIVEEAGGRFTDLAGDRRIDGGNAVATNGPLHDAVLEAMQT